VQYYQEWRGKNNRLEVLFLLKLKKLINFYATTPNEKTRKLIKNILFLKYLTIYKANNYPTHKAILFLGLQNTGGKDIVL
jgi:hypothetical protein